jgi:hypothetical protein
MEVLGSGGFGLVLVHRAGGVVKKLMYAEHCGSASVEFVFQKKAHRALLTVPSIMVPRPLRFSERPAMFNGAAFPCSLSMTFVQPPHGHTMLLHCCLNADVPAANALVGRKPALPIDMHTNPPRGFFASSDYLDEYLATLAPDVAGAFKSSADVAYHIGIAYARLVMIARLFPFDVEFTLGLRSGRLALCVLDFGLVDAIPSDISVGEAARLLVSGNGRVGGSEFDIYLPQPDSPLYEPFRHGCLRGGLACIDDMERVLNFQAPVGTQPLFINKTARRRRQTGASNKLKQ